MILASAQTNPKQFDIQANLEGHYRLIELASENGVDLIMFPEMSITGYEREKAKEMAFRQDDPRLKKLKELSVKNKIVVITGAPILIENNLYIGAFIIKPDNTVSIYTKQFLHAGEELFYESSFDYNPIIEIKNERISLAICADICNPKHPENAHNAGATIYLASIFYTPNGISEAYEDLSSYSSKYQLNVLMSNFCGQSYGFDAAGQSGFWNKSGRLVSKMDSSNQGLLLTEKIDDEWKGEIILMEEKWK